jgi:hypothetical protein
MIRGDVYGSFKLHATSRSIYMRRDGLYRVIISHTKYFVTEMTSGTLAKRLLAEIYHYVGLNAAVYHGVKRFFSLLGNIMHGACER